MSLRCRRKREGRCRGGENQCPVLSLHRCNPSHCPVSRVLRRLEMRRPVEPVLIRCHSLGSARFRSLYLRIFISLYIPLASEMFPGY